MRILLINPSINFNKFGRFKRYMQPMPPIGLAYIAGMLKKNNIDFKVIDDFAENKRIKGILNVFKSYLPNIIGISCLTPSAPYVFAIAKAIKICDQQVKIVLGNIHASVFSNLILEHEAIDIIVHGEGELTFLDVAEAVSKKTDLESIKGISFKQNQKIINTPPRPLLKDLDSLPYPAWEHFPFKSYGLLPFMDIKKPALSILASRGCVNRCSYCSLLYLNGNYRKRNYIKIVDEVEYLVNSFGVKQLGFVDPIFPLSRDDCIDFCKEMIKRRLNKHVVWISETRPDCMDQQLLKLMKESGCRRLLYGIESGDKDILDSMSKHMLLNKVRENISHTKNAGIEVAGLFMIGFPQEDETMVVATINFAKSLNLDFAKFAIVVPFPGSKLFDDLMHDDKFNRSDWENFVTFNPNPSALVSVNKEISPERLIALQLRAHREFYLRPKMILRHLFKIRTIKLPDLIHSIGALFLHGKLQSVQNLKVR